MTSLQINQLHEVNQKIAEIWSIKLSNFSRQKDYIKNEYARYWLKARCEKYGCTDYDHALLGHLVREVIGRV